MTVIKRPLRLRTKIAFHFVALVACWTVLIVVALRCLLDQMVQRFFRERGAQIVRTLAAESLPVIHYDEVATLAGIFQHYREAYPEIRYIAVLDAEGNPLQSTFQHGVPPDLLALDAGRGPGSEVVSRLIQSGEQRLYDYEYAKAGFRIRAGLSLEPVEALTRRTTVYVLAIGLAGLIGVVAFALRISKPVEVLTRAIERVVMLERGGAAAADPRGTLETAAIAEHFRELFERLEERTRQLDASRKLAYLGEISASIAHEVNNPLGVVVMNSGFLAKRAEKGEFPPGVEREVARLDAAARRAALAVQKLLQFARYSRRGDGLRLRSVDLRMLVGETVDLLQDRLQARDCRVRVDIPPDLQPVECDEQGLQQVLLNLLANAADASPQGAEITVKAEAGAGGVVLEVRDQGEGMSAEVLKQAKDPFFSTKEAGRGTGLGLAISDSIVRAHGGELHLESTPGKGTTAVVRLPPGGPASAETAGVEGERTAGGGMSRGGRGAGR